MDREREERGAVISHPSDDSRPRQLVTVIISYPTIANYNPHLCSSGRYVRPKSPRGTHLRDVDEQAGVGDVGDADQPLLDDALPLDLHAGHRGARRQQQRRRPRAGVLSDVVDLLGRDRNGLMRWVPGAMGRIREREVEWDDVRERK